MTGVPSAVSVPVAAGLKEHLSPHLAPPGTLTRAKNVRFPVEGEAQARRGTTALSAATDADVAYTDVMTGGGPDFISPCPGGFFFGAKGYGYRYDFEQERVHVAGSYSNAVPDGRFAAIASEQASLTMGNNTPWPLSVATGNGYVAVCWSGGNGAQSVQGTQAVIVHVYTEDGTRVGTIERTDYSTGAVVFDDSGDGQFVLVAQQAASGTPTNLDAAVLTVGDSGVTVGAFTTVQGLQASNSIWAVCTWPGLGWALVAQSGAITAAVRRLTGTTSIDSNSFATAAATTPLSVYADETHIYVGFVDVGANATAFARVFDVNMDLTSGVAAVTVWADSAGASLTLGPPLFGSCAQSQKAFLVVGRSTSLSGDNGTGTRLRAFVLAYDGTLTSTNQIGAYHMIPVSAPFNNGMVWCRYRTPNHSVYGNNYFRHVLLDFMAARQSTADSFWTLKWPRVALVGEAFADPAAGNYRAGVAFLHYYPPQQLEDGRWLVGLPRLVRAETVTGNGWGLALAEWLAFWTGKKRRPLQIADETIVPGSPVLLGTTSSHGTSISANPALGLPAAANQNYGIDLGFVVEPAIDQGVESNGAGALTAGGTYKFRTVIEWIDGKARRWRSRASRVQSMSALGPGNDTYTFTSADDFSWLRQDAGLINGASAPVKHYYRNTSNGDRFYRATPPQGVPLALAGASYVDLLSDTDLETREWLYTDGGVLDNDHAPSCQNVAASGDRLWFGGLWDKKQICSSKIIVPGEPYQCSDSPAMRVPLKADNTGIATQDGVTIAFAQHAIYTVAGAGPTDQGQGAWDSARVLTESTGCVNDLSILETSAGVFFESGRGLELLPRGQGEPVFIGTGIQDSFPGGVTGCAVIESEESRTARFCVGTTQVFVFDLDRGAWSIDEYPMAVTGICDTERGAVLARATVSDGGFGFLLEDADADLDSEGDSPAELESELEWSTLRPFGICGWGQFDSAVAMFDTFDDGYGDGEATLVVDIDDDGDAGGTFDMTELGDAEAYREHVPAEKMGTALRLGLSTTAGGWRFMGWSVGVQETGGVRRVAAEERA